MLDTERLISKSNDVVFFLCGSDTFNYMVFDFNINVVINVGELFRLVYESD